MHYKRFPLGALWTNGYLFWDDGGEAFSGGLDSYSGAGPTFKVLD